MTERFADPLSAGGPLCSALALVVAKQRVEEQGGALSAEAGAEGGAELQLRLPLRG